MTLIAAWITPEFRIVASDSKLNDRDGNLIDEKCRKIFVSNNLAIGLFGGFDIPFNLFKKFKLLKGVMQAENWDLEKFRSELSKYLENEHISNSGENKESNILVVSKNDEAFILRFQSDRKIEEFKLIDYKSIYQKYLPPDLFFSEQQLDNGNIDFIHQMELLKHFTFIKDEFINENSKFQKYNWPIEVKILMSLIIDSKNNTNPKIYRRNIGGLKTYCAFSYKDNNWQQIIYPEDETFSWVESMQQINEKLDLESKESHLP